MAKYEKYKEKYKEDIHVISVDGIEESLDKYLEVKSLYKDHSLEKIQEYKDVIIIGEWEIHDESIERYVSLEFIFGNKYNNGEPATEEQILDYIDDYDLKHDYEITHNSYSNIYRDPFGRASVNVIYEKYIKLLEN